MSTILTSKHRRFKTSSKHMLMSASLCKFLSCVFHSIVFYLRLLEYYVNCVNYHYHKQYLSKTPVVQIPHGTFNIYVKCLFLSIVNLWSGRQSFIWTSLLVLRYNTDICFYFRLKMVKWTFMQQTFSRFQSKYCSPRCII